MDPLKHLLDLVYLCALIANIVFGKSRRGIWNRILGRTDIRLPRNGVRVWFHGVSVGEVHLLRGVVARFRERYPEAQCIISSTTDTGLDEARKAFPDLPVIAWPMDFSWVVERALREIQPHLVVVAEGEFWPNFLLAAKRRNIPVVAINVRFSPRSARRYQRFRSLARRWLGLVRHFAVQTSEYARCLTDLQIVADRVTVTGSVKYDGVRTSRTHPKTAELRKLFQIRQDELVWVAGSTQEPEEQIVLDIYQRLVSRYSNLRLIIVPRQRDRFDAVAALIQRSGMPFVQRSQLTSFSREGSAATQARSIILLDTIGELAAVWTLADIAFVGGSLDGRRGGQNMIEPAACGAALMFGPHTWNFRDTVERLIDAQAAIIVSNGAELEAAVAALLENRDERTRLSQAARNLVLSQQGATDRTLDVIEQFLPRFVRARSA